MKSHIYLGISSVKKDCSWLNNRWTVSDSPALSVFSWFCNSLMTCLSSLVNLKHQNNIGRSNHYARSCFPWTQYRYIHMPDLWTHHRLYTNACCLNFHSCCSMWFSAEKQFESIVELGSIAVEGWWATMLWLFIIHYAGFGYQDVKISTSHRK